MELSPHPNDIRVRWVDKVRRVREGNELNTTMELLQFYYKAGQVRQMSHEKLIPVPPVSVMTLTLTQGLETGWGTVAKKGLGKKGRQHGLSDCKSLLVSLGLGGRVESLWMSSSFLLALA